MLSFVATKLSYSKCVTVEPAKRRQEAWLIIHANEQGYVSRKLISLHSLT